MDITRPILVLAALNYAAAAMLAWVTLIQIGGYFFFATAISAQVLLPLPSLFGVAVGIANGLLLVRLDRAGQRARTSISAASMISALLLVALFIYSMSTRYASGPDIHMGWIFAAVLFGATSAFVWMQPPLHKPHACPNCGYDATGLTTCPECGTGLPPSPHRGREQG